MKAGRWIRIFILSGFIAAFVFFVIRFGKGFIHSMLPLGLGIIISYMELPVVEAMEKLKVKRAISILMSFAVSFFIIIIILLCIIPLLIDNINNLTKTIPNIFNVVFNNIMLFMEKNIPLSWQQDLLKELDKNLVILQDRLTQGVYRFISNLPKTVSFIFDALVAWILSFYILRDREKIIEGIKHFFPASVREDIICFCRDIHRIVLRFIQGQVLIAIIVAIAETTGLYLIGMPYAPLLGFIGGVSNIVPYFGPYIGAIPAIAVALTVSPWKAVWTAVVYIIVQQLDNIFLSPKIMKGKLGLHPVTTIMAVIAGGRLFGIIGLLFSVPFTAMLKVMFKRIFKLISG